jgi:DNA transformation protein and related proteins
MSKKPPAIKNMGPKSTEWLKEIGIFTVEDVEREGVMEVYLRLKAGRPGISRVMLYALQGAVLNLHWNALPDELKEELLQQLDES